MYQITLSIDGMACGMCESHVCDTIRSKFSVKKVTASHSKGEAVILTMSYVLNSLNREETIAMENEDDIPYFRNLQMENIEVTGCRQFTKIEPLQGRPETIQNVVINGQKLA